MWRPSSRPSGVVRLATRDKNRPSHPVSPCRHGRRGLLFAGMTNNHPSRIAGRPAVWAGNGLQPAGHPHNKRQERVGCQQPARFLLGYPPITLAVRPRCCDCARAARRPLVALSAFLDVSLQTCQLAPGWQWYSSTAPVFLPLSSKQAGVSRRGGWRRRGCIASSRPSVIHPSHGWAIEDHQTRISAHPARSAR